MGGSSIEDDWDFPSLSNGARTILLVGRTGSGKSATGNSILGKKVFKSRVSGKGVTRTTEMQSTTLKDGQVINVIETVGIFDPILNSEVIGKEMVKSIEMAKDGIHAIVLVLTSVGSRFTEEEARSLDILQSFFGPKITDYMIVVFMGGDKFEGNDEFEADDHTFDGYLVEEYPETLQDILRTCKHRCVLFNNTTKDALIKSNQRQHLLNFIDTIMQENRGRRYSDSIFKEVKELQNGMMKLREEDQLLNRITEMVESKLKEATKKLEEQLAEEQAARLRAEENAQAALWNSNDEIRKLRENLERAQRDTEELRKFQENLERAQRDTEELRKFRENLERAQRETEELRKGAEGGGCYIL